MKEWTIESLFKSLPGKYNYTCIGQTDTVVNGIAPLNNSHSMDLTFCSSVSYDGLKSITSSDAGIILCSKKIEQIVQFNEHQKQMESEKNRNYEYRYNRDKLLVFVDNPRLLFIRFANKIGNLNKADTGRRISNHAKILSSVNIGNGCKIGDYTTIDNNCIIGDNTIIGARVTITNSIIGNNCIIQSGCVIGEDGFAYERDNQSYLLEKFPHYGKVLINDRVEILANCSIARGSLSDTIIREGTKVDALCHIAHNTNIGKNCQLAAGVVIGGSVNIGDSCWIGLNSTIKQKINIGNNVIIGSGSSVIYDVKDKDIVAGAPGKSIKDRVSENEDKLFLMAGHRNGSTYQEFTSDNSINKKRE